MNRIILIFAISILCVSCASNSQKYYSQIRDSIPIYANQTEIMDGVYFNDPYSYSYTYKTLLDFMKLKDHNVDSVRLSLVDAKRLKVVSYNALKTQTQFVEGELVNGAFQIKKKRKWFGIPFLLFAKSKETVRLHVGVLDEIIVVHYQSSTSHFFGKTNSESTTDYYHYSKTLEVIP